MVVVQSFHVVLSQLPYFLGESRSYAADQIEDYEFLFAPCLLYDSSEHPQREHIEEYVLHIGVHEHVCYQLIRSEIRCHEEVKPQHGVEIHSTKLENVFSQEEYHVDDNQVFCNGRCLEHNVFLNIIHGKVMKLSAYYIIIMPYRPN